jgi:hypothetical protein
MEGSLMAFKVFTNGSVLQASEVNDNLMRQAVSTFTNAAARTAAIPSPSEGMLTYLEDSDRYSFWSGASWLSPFGMTLIGSQSFTSAGFIVVDNVFTSEFDAYKIVTASTSSTAVDVSLQFRVSGSTANTNYNDVNLQGLGSTASVTTRTSQAAANVGRFDTNGGIIETLINNVAVAQRTYGISTAHDSLNVIQSRGFHHTTATAYTGFAMGLNGTTGTIRVYGLRK